MGKLLPTPYDKQVLMAVRALFDGVANEGQQKTVVRWLIDVCCHVGEPSFAETDRDTAFLEGERHVGLQLITMRSHKGLANLEEMQRRLARGKKKALYKEEAEAQ